MAQSTVTVDPVIMPAPMQDAGDWMIHLASIGSCYRCAFSDILLQRTPYHLVSDNRCSLTQHAVEEKGERQSAAGSQK